MTQKRVFIIAGEASGDLHGSNLVAALKKRRPKTAFRGLGGDRMASEGVELLAHIRDISFMGFWEVIKNLGTIRRLFKLVKNDIRSWKPDAVVLIDYPGFNLRMAKFIHKLGIPVVYYISPQVWAWKKGRVKTIRRYVDRMLVILPFEKEFYAGEQTEVEFVGHPLLDELDPGERQPAHPPVLALLPGSRRQEIARMLPVMLEAAQAFPELQVKVAGAPGQEAPFYDSFLEGTNAELVQNRTYDLLREAKAALVTSGTATLETGLLGVPQVVCYRGSAISYQIARRLVKVDYISLVNLTLGRQVVEELIQNDFNVFQLKEALSRILEPEAQKRLSGDYAELREKLGRSGASERVARILEEVLGEPASPLPAN